MEVDMLIFYDELKSNITISQTKNRFQNAAFNYESYENTRGPNQRRCINVCLERFEVYFIFFIDNCYN